MTTDFETRRDMAWKARKAARNHTVDSHIAGAIIQAAISAEYVTGTPEWDRLLSIMQAEAETARAAKTALEAALMAPDIMDPQRMMQIKIDALILAERIKVIEAVVALPSNIMRDGENARLQMKESQDA